MSNLNVQLEDLYNELNVKIEEWQEAADELAYIEENKDEYIEESDFEEILDAEGVVTVGGLDFYPSTILKECDPVAYNIAWSEFCDSVDITEYVQYKEVEAEAESLEAEIEDLKAEIENLEEIISEAEVYA